MITLPSAPAAAPISSNGRSTNPSFMELDPDAGDIDDDDNGIQTGGSGGSVSSQPITLEVENEPENEPGQGGGQDTVSALGYVDNSGNMTVDFGFFAPVSVGDTAFIDVDMNDVQSAGDLPLQDVTVTIYDAATRMPVMFDAEGNAYDNDALTGPDGDYLFTGLPPGSYYVEFDIEMIDNGDLYTFVAPNVGDDALDSDATPTNPTGSVANSTPTAFLSSGDEDRTLDAGVVCAIEVEVAQPFTICANQPIDLTVNTSITPLRLGGVWTTLEGASGTFDDGAGVFGTATTYTASQADINRGFVTLVLSTNDPANLSPASNCLLVSDRVEVTILKVDCGEFMWDGN